MYHKIIFVGGIHGVGKSTLCSSIANSNDSFVHVMASSLVKTSPFSKVIEEEDIIQNQNQIINALDSIQNTEQIILLDGHFALTTQKKSIIRIPLSIFKQINPIRFIVIIDNALQVQKNLFARDAKEYTLGMINKMQEKEVSYAEELSRNLNIQLDIINVNNLEAIYNSVNC